MDPAVNDNKRKMLAEHPYFEAYYKIIPIFVTLCVAIMPHVSQYDRIWVAVSIGHLMMNFVVAWMYDKLPGLRHDDRRTHLVRVAIVYTGIMPPYALACILAVDKIEWGGFIAICIGMSVFMLYPLLHWLYRRTIGGVDWWSRFLMMAMTLALRQPGDTTGNVGLCNQGW